MIIGILKEPNDRRVALTPLQLPKFDESGIDFLVETGAGADARYTDEAYAGKAEVTDRNSVLERADLLLSIAPLPDAELDQLTAGKTLVAQFAPFQDPDIKQKLIQRQLHGLSLDMIPRTTLAQSMDVLSSMASVAGYRAVLEAANHLPRYFPMLITAAGSIRPATVLILGAGVAGLQAIATARRLGAQVEAFDTRQAAKEEVESLGARFVEVEGAKDDTSAGGYAVEQSEEFLERQRQEVQTRAAKADVIITTAQVRGRKAPLLVPASTVEKMKSGSVIVDLAASTGGNCELTQNDRIVEAHGVIIIGNSNLPQQMAQDASQLYGNNVTNFLQYIIKDGELALDQEDEIIRSAYFTADIPEQTNA